MSEYNEDFFEQDRGERAYYKRSGPAEQVTLPLTRDGFEALLEQACLLVGQDVKPNDGFRRIMAGFLHHIEAGVSTTTIGDLGAALHKSVANLTSWRIDQAIKLKEREENQKKQAEANAAAEALKKPSRRVRRARAKLLQQTAVTVPDGEAA